MVSVEAIVGGIITKGIKHLSEKYQSQKNDTQIRIYFDEIGALKYDACVGWQPKETLTFKQIINRKLDIFGYEQTCAPSFANSLKMFCEQHEVDYSNVSGFFFLTKNNTVGISFFDGSKSVETVRLSEQLERLGL